MHVCNTESFGTEDSINMPQKLWSNSHSWFIVATHWIHRVSSCFFLICVAYILNDVFTSGTMGWIGNVHAIKQTWQKLNCRVRSWLCISTTVQRLFIFLNLCPKELELKHAKECMCLGRTHTFTWKITLNQLMLLGNRNLELWAQITGTNRKIQQEAGRRGKINYDCGFCQAKLCSFSTTSVKCDIRQFRACKLGFSLSDASILLLEHNYIDLPIAQ